MPEHTPAPLPHRAVYGFAFYLFFLTLLIVYTIWALVPTYILEEHLSLYYLPDKYFALYVPILVLCAVTIFAFVIYPSINLAMTPNITEKRTILDSHTVYRCNFSYKDGTRCDNQLQSEDTHSPWNVGKFCHEHGDSNDHVKLNSGAVLEKEVCSFCQLKHTSPYLQGTQLKRCPRIPAVRDLDLQDVCKQIFK